MPRIGKSFTFTLSRVAPEGEDRAVLLIEDNYIASVSCLVRSLDVAQADGVLRTLTNALRPTFDKLDGSLLTPSDPELRVAAVRMFPWMRRWRPPIGDNTCVELAEHLFMEQLWREVAPHELVPVDLEVRCPTKQAGRVVMPASSWAMLTAWLDGARSAAPPYGERSVISFDALPPPR